MTELTIRPDEIRDALERFVSSYEPDEADKAEVGRVIDTGDGIARVEGLHSTMTNELLDFGDGVLGIALNLDVREIGCVILGDAQHIREGQEVRRTGEILSIPVGDGFLGRVVDPLGRPLDGKGDVESTERRVLETQAPSVVQRQPVKEPLQTGVKAIDAMTAIGRGQRQLIIGDRQTGKTAVALDAIINQRDNWKSGDPKKQVKCVYVAIGQKGTTVREVVNTLEEAGAMEYTTVVSAPASFPAAFKYLAPYAGSALGQYWMYQGQHALIVFDDLSKQAEAYRAISLLLRRPAGREAYPGDVFYLHSRLLERCAKLSDELGGGSLTGLPIIETKGNDISAYIPTNVISITDGQIFLETDLFNSGVRPAINVGVSVSRVGGAAQVRALRTVSGRLRLDLAQFRELEAFSAFGSDLDRASKRQLERGARLVELLKQPQYQPVPGRAPGGVDLGRHDRRPRRHPGRRHPPLRGRLPRPHRAGQAGDLRGHPGVRQARGRHGRRAGEGDRGVQEVVRHQRGAEGRQRGGGRGGEEGRRVARVGQGAQAQAAEQLSAQARHDE